MPYVYILRCADGARLSQHLNGFASSFTAKRLPVELVYVEEADSSRAAVTRERQLKRWTRAKKEALIEGNLPSLHALSKRRKP